MSRVTINEKVTITQLGFKKNLSAYPRRMEYQGAVYEFLDAGLRCLVRSGGSVAEILTMTDGIRQYRLRTDNNGGAWTLLGIIS